nr:DUF485 domain-containing protein [Nocardiopsis algeriensis]
MEGAHRESAGERDAAPDPHGPHAAAARRRARESRADAYERLSVDPRFVRLRRLFAVHAGLLVLAFMLSYMSYLLFSAYGRDFLAIRVVGPVNVALLAGMGQFLVVFLLAWGFERFSARSTDLLAEQVRDQARGVGCAGAPHAHRRGGRDVTAEEL